MANKVHVSLRPSLKPASVKGDGNSVYNEILLGLLELRSNAAKTAAPREIAAE